MQLRGFNLLTGVKRRAWLLRLAVLAVMAVALFLAACEDDDEETTSSPTGTGTASSPVATDDPNVVAGYPRCAPGGSNSLAGAGATFPNPLYTKWIDEYKRACNVEVNYQSIGSGGGIRQITEKTVNFGASDGVLTDAQEQAAVAAGGSIMHIAMTSGAVAVIYNLQGVQSGQLKLDGPTLADIYLGNITKWNDAKIVALNPGVSLPNADIAVVHRSDGSGTTFIFANYLSKVSPAWQSGPGFATSVQWPTGLGAAGNEGVAGQVRQLPGSIGYAELAYAHQNNLAFAQMKNKSGAYVTPTLEATTAAAAGVTIPAHMKILITDSSNAAAYPISGFTWILAYQNQEDASKGKALAHYLWWAIHNGQSFATDLDYAPLAPDAAKAAENQILKLQCGGAACLTK